MSMGWLPIVVADTKTVSVIIVSLVTFVLGIPASVIQRVMYANQKAWLSHIWQIGGAVLSVILTLLAIHYTLPAWQIIAAYSAPAVIILLVSTLFFFYKHDALRPHIGDISKESAFDLLKIGSRFLALSVVTSCALNVDNVLISYQLGAAAVTEYAVPAKLASLLGLVVSTVFLPLWAANGEALARRDYAWVRRTTIKMTILGSSIVAFFAFLMILFGGWFIRLWMGKSFEWQIETLIGLSSLSVFMAVSSPCQMLLNSMGEIKIQIKIWAVFLILSIALKLYLLYFFNFWVVPMITSGLYLCIVIPTVLLHAKKIINQHEVQP
jgi:O-antigen/teichoic acid export membrane protein